MRVIIAICLSFFISVGMFLLMQKMTTTQSDVVKKRVKSYTAYISKR